MKVYNLACAQAHRFEGWFASDDDYAGQQQRGLLECPMCGDSAIRKLPSAPRLNLSGAQAPVAAPTKPAATPTSASTTIPVPAGAPPDLQAVWMQAVKQVLERTEDVGDRFAEEARRIHYGESEERGIRGRATAKETEALREEGIEVMALPIPPALKGPMQ